MPVQFEWQKKSPKRRDGNCRRDDTQARSGASNESVDLVYNLALFYGELGIFASKIEVITNEQCSA